MSEEPSFMMSYSGTFRAIRVSDQEFTPCTYEIKCDLVPNSMNEKRFNQSLARLNWWIKNIVDDSIILSSGNGFFLETILGDASNNVVLLPVPCSDDYLAIVLFEKINAILNNEMYINVLDIKSDASSGVSFSYLGNNGEILPSISEWLDQDSFDTHGYWFDQPWWKRNDGTTVDFPIVESEKDDTHPKWGINLEFINDMFEDKKPAPVVKPEFKPTVIQGGSKE